MMVRMVVENRSEPRSSKEHELGGQWSKMTKKHGRQERGVTLGPSLCTGPRQASARQQLITSQAVRRDTHTMGRPQSTVWQSATLRFSTSAPRLPATQAMSASCVVAARHTTVATTAPANAASNDGKDMTAHSSSTDGALHTLTSTHEQTSMPHTQLSLHQPLDMISSCETLIQSCLSEHNTPDHIISTAADCDSDDISAPTAFGPNGTATFLSDTSFILDTLITEMSNHESVQASNADPTDEGLLHSEDAVTGLDWEIVRALQDEDETETDEDEYVML